MKFILLNIFLISFFCGFSQDSIIYFEKEVKCIGPFSLPHGGLYSAGVGAVSSIKVNPQNPEQIYIGTMSGGFWKSENGGKNWKCLSDNILAGGNKFDVHPQNFDIVYINSGLSVIQGSLLRNGTYGQGLFYSENGGKTWKNLSENNPKLNTYIADIKIHTQKPNTIYSCSQNAFFYSGNSGKDFKTFDFPFNKNKNFFIEIDFSQNDFENVFLSGRNVFYKFNLKTGKYFDLKDTIQTKKDDVIFSTAVFNDTIYNLMCKKSGQSVLRISADKGNTWIVKDLRNFSGRLYVQALEISPKGEIFAGGIYLYKQDKSKPNYFKNITNNLHPDIRSVYFPDKNNDKLVFVGNDGGIFKSEDAGENWTDISGDLCSSLFLSIDIHQKTPDLIIGGTGDCGTLLHKPDGSWHAVYGCDGGSSMIDFADTNNVWIMCNRSLNFSAKAARNGTFRGTRFPEAETFFDAPLVQHPINPEIFYTGEWSVSELTDKGETRIYRTWINDYENAGTAGQITNIAICESNPNYIYFSCAGLNEKAPFHPSIWLSKTGIQGTLNEITKGTGLENFNINSSENTPQVSGITIFPNDSLICWVSVNGFEDKLKVLYTVNAGETWTNISYNLPNTPVNCLVYCDSENSLYIGTDTGIFRLENGEKTWQKLKNFPVVVVSELKVNKNTNELIIATYGRGVWKMKI